MDRLTVREVSTLADSMRMKKEQETGRKQRRQRKARKVFRPVL